MNEGEPAGMEEEPPHALLFQPAIELEIAVLGVAEHRMAGLREVDADLVGSTCQEPDFEQAELGRLLQRPHLGHGFHAVLPHRDPALALGVYILVERLAQLARTALPGTLRDGEINLLDLALAQHPVELDQRAALS